MSDLESRIQTLENKIGKLETRIIQECIIIEHVMHKTTQLVDVVNNLNTNDSLIVNTLIKKGAVKSINDFFEDSDKVKAYLDKVDDFVEHLDTKNIKAL